MSPVQDAIEQSQYLTFYLAGEEYGIGILQAKEILEYDTLTKVPQTPPSIRSPAGARRCRAARWA